VLRDAIVIICFAILLVIARPCAAAPPPGTDPSGKLHQWFEHQHSIIGAWCCNVADGHILAQSEWRTSMDHYDVWIAGLWRQVPSSALRDPSGGPNPTGRAVVWWTLAGSEIVILCFAPGIEL
jgi:hypothetical protein